MKKLKVFIVILLSLSPLYCARSKKDIKWVFAENSKWYLVKDGDHKSTEPPVLRQKSYNAYEQRKYGIKRSFQKKTT